jgi:ribulose-phosphate 3-epimerase
MPQVSASLLAADIACLGDEIRRATQAGVDSFHFDMMDGHYVPNLAFAPDTLAALRPLTGLPFHVHLELNNPDEMLEKFRPFAADLMIACLDTLLDPRQTLERMRRRNARVGLSLNPDDPLTKVQSLLSELDVLLLLGVYPGFGGQPMQANTPARVAEAARQRDGLGLPLRIAVDGGVNLNNAPALVEAGADILVVGTALFKAPDMRISVSELKAGAAGRHPR